MKNNLKLIVIAVLCMWMGQKTSAEEHYLVGGCTASGWNTGEDTRSPVAMMKVSSDTWVWYGKLTTADGDAGRFKIPNSAGGWDGYWAPSQDFVLTSDWSDLSTNSSGDNKYKVSVEGIYKITIDTSTSKIKAEKLTEPSKEGDYYLLGSVSDYYWFAGSVTSGEQNYKARLTADLDFTDKEFYPIGSEKANCRFKGEFDGQGHSISNFTINSDYNKLALFRGIEGATIKNLKVEGSINTNGYQMGGLVGISHGSSTIQKVLVATDMTSSHSGDGTHGGLIAVAHDVPTIENAAFVGSINASNDDGTCGMIGYAHSGGSIYYTNCFVGGTLTLKTGNNRVFGRNGEHCDNCYTTLTDMTKLNDADRFVGGGNMTSSQVTSGELAYKLNGSVSGGSTWHQLIGTDAYPVPFAKAGAVVYANGLLYCDGELKPGSVYENEEKEAIRDAHNFNDWGFCTNSHDEKTCNDLQPDFITPDGEGNYLIGTKAQLNWFAHRVNGHGSLAGIRNLNGRLTADIDFSDQSAMIGNGDEAESYQGTFDGQGYAITVAYAVNQKNVALFRYLKNATIRNLITRGTIRNENNSCTGGIFAGSRGATVIENCVSYVAINRTTDGDATIGGIGAYMHDNGKIQNCAFYGSIDAPNATGNGGLLGYANGGNNVAVENCLVNTSAFNYNNSSVSVARNTGNVKNTYVVNCGTATQKEEIKIDGSKLATGELCYLLNGSVSGATAWQQVIGTDSTPLPFAKDGAIVYANGTLYCDGDPKSVAYENEERELNRESHNYSDWGFCVNSHDAKTCDELQLDFADVSNGYYQLDDYKKLNWFATLVNRGIETNAKAQLTADIEMQTAFPCIGNGTNRFSGELDGQKHHIKNWIVTDATEKMALVRCGKEGLVLKNITIDNTCSLQSTATVAGFVADINGASNGENKGALTLLNLGNEGTMNGGSNTGGIAGCNYNGNIVITMKNCYNTGSITATVEGGALSGWLGTDARVYNCYNTGSITKGVGLFRGNGTYYNENTYSTVNNNDGGGNNAEAKQILSADKFSDGTVFAGLFDYNENDVNGKLWRMEFSGTAHPVLYDADLVLKEDFPNRFVSKDNVNLTLERTTVADVWNTICLPFDLSASQIADVFGATAKVAELTGATDETVYFTTVSTIAAGKAYLVKPSEAMTSKALTGVDLVADAPTPTTQSGYAFTGIYEPTTVVANDLFVAAENKLVPSDGNGKLKAFRAYFHNTGAEARFANFVIDDITTGLKTVMPAFTEVQGSVFDLQGRRVVSPAKGLYVVGGRKMVIK